VRGGCGAESRAHAGAGIGGQGELADQQQPAAGLCQGAVHAALGVGEDPVAEQAPGHPRHLRLAIARLHAHQRQQARPDAADRLAPDADAGFADALDQAEHGRRTRWTRGRSRSGTAWPAGAARKFAIPTAAAPARARAAQPPRYTGRVNELLARVLYLLAAMVGRLPWTALRRMGDALAWLWLRAGARESRVALRNLELAYPELLPAQRGEWRWRVLRSTGLQTLQTLRLWTRPHAENLGLIEEVHGEALFDEALAAGRGLIVAAPHFGNWELLNQWLAAKTPLAILYKPPESAIGEAFLRRVRADADAGRITQVRAEGAGVRQLYKRLQ